MVSGLAGHHIGAFSFNRYRPSHSNTGLGDSQQDRRAVLLTRACKTAVHELGHMFGIGHCVYRECCMQGSGHLREDFTIPHALCPVDLCKFKAALGEDFDAVRRYGKLLRFYETHHGFGPQAEFVREALGLLRGSGDEAIVRAVSEVSSMD